VRAGHQLAARRRGRGRRDLGSDLGQRLGVRQGGLVQAATTVLKLVPLVAIATIGLFFIKSGNFHPFNASGTSAFHAVTAAAALTLWAFIGLESATVPAGDVYDPKRTITRSTVIGARWAPPWSTSLARSR
jgi:amino acid transporter